TPHLRDRRRGRAGVVVLLEQEGRREAHPVLLPEEAGDARRGREAAREAQGMRRRASVLLAALVYVLGGTNLALGALDLVAPRSAPARSSAVAQSCCCGSADLCRCAGCCHQEEGASPAP